ncbi:MAG: hypothetical protein P4L35_08935 [Ignavibacteriaceae bacterium]|nr:hypothetical protein [Ignavibacteriaceae bacterium]
MDTIYVSTQKTFWDSLPVWLSAIGTISAVITSLYFSQRNKKLIGVVTIEKCILRDKQAIVSNNPNAKFIRIVITNIAQRSFTVADIGIKVGLFKKGYESLKLEDFHWDEILHEYKDGQESLLCIKKEDFEAKEIVRLRRYLQKKIFPNIAKHFIRLYVEISHRKRFYTRLPRVLEKEYFENLKRG